MKKILFTCGNMSIGGVQKSLVSLLASIDFELYDVYLMIPSFSGDLLNQVPKEVKLIKAPEIITTPSFSKIMIKSDFKYILNNPSSLVSYLKAAKLAIRKNSKYARHRYWELTNHKVKLAKEINQDYDIAISYAGGIGIWNQLILDKIKAKKYICWVHGDYSKFGTGSDHEKSYFKQFDKVVTVSETAEKILLKAIPALNGRTVVIHNIIDQKGIYQLANKERVYDINFKGIQFVSISRLDKGKGFDLAIKAFSRVVSEGHNVKWDIIGDGNEYGNLLHQIKSLGLKGKVSLLGLKSNPYPYLYQADVFFHPSRGEGKSISVDEAKVLSKPILITSYPTVRDQIEDGITGMIVPITEEGIYQGIIEMSRNNGMRNKLIENLERFEIETNSFEKVLNIIKNKV